MKRFPLFAIFIGIAVVAHGATFTVTTTSDGGPGSLRAAIADAASGDTIVFQIPTSDAGYNASTGFWTILLTGATAANKTFVIDKNLTIDASGQNMIVRRDPAAPADFRIFYVPGASTVILRRLWISNGNVTAAGGDVLERWGAGIRSSGTLIVDECRFTGNAAESAGALLNFGGKLTVTRSTFSGNSASAYGGAMLTTSLNLNVIERCTFNQNNAGQGGAIYNNQGFAAIRSCTIVGNPASIPIVGGNLGGGIVAISGAKGETQMENSIVVGNTSAGTAPDIAGSINSLGHNLLGSTDNTGGLFGPGDQNNVTLAQVNLEPLADNGGFAQTMRPKAGSVAIDKGKRTADANEQPTSTDQRGFPRPVDRPESNSVSGDGSDIGSVEAGAPQAGPAFTVNTTAERNDNECTSDDCTLVEALNVANAIADANTINFAPTVKGAILTNTLTPNGLAITQQVTINGPGARVLSINANFLGRAFNVSGPNVVISGLSIINGRKNNDNGGGILNTGSLTLNDCMILLNGTRMSSGNGGGIYNSLNATLNLNRCTIDGNSSVEFGGGVYSDGNVIVTNCSFSSNTAVRGGGIISRAAGGASSMTLRNCTFTFNAATSTNAGPGDGGGGVFAEGNATQYHMSNTIVAGNSNAINPDVRGNFTSDGNNFIGNVANSVGFSNNVNGDQVGTPGNVKDPMLSGAGNFGGPVDSRPLLPGSPCINAGNDALAPPTDQRGYGRNGVSDIGSFEFQGLLPVTLANISTRLRVETGDNVLIGGFIITGTQPKKVIIRAIGPSLPFGGVLANPTLELYQGATLLASNDDWENQPPADRQAVIDSTIPPGNDLEAALVRSLPANNAAYTAIVRGANGGTGIGVVEAYDLDRSVDSKLANISTRGLVQTGDNVLIAGTIVLGSQAQKVIIRAIGPSLPIPGKLENPTLELRDGNGVVVESNDDWANSANKQAIIDSTIPPANDLESAVVRTLTPAAYTAIVRGVNDTAGIAVVEVYTLN